MVKKTGGREINPADAFRKTQRAKEIARNKKERKFQRDAFSLKSQPDQIKEELEKVIDNEGEGKLLNQTLRLKKRALQSAYDAALKKKREDEVRKNRSDTLHLTDPALGTGVRRPEDSVYFHPTINPLGLPPTGKPQRYRTSVLSIEDAPGSSQSVAALPVPKAPPLPRGPAPSQSAPHQLPGPSASLGADGVGLLPPPDGPPPGVAAAGASSSDVLPPPAGPPPAFQHMLPPPNMLAPGLVGGVLPPPMMPPPSHLMMPPPPGPPPAALAAGVGQAKRDTKSIFTGQSTVVKMPRANEDKTVTAMVPASVRVRREQAGNAATARPRIGLTGASAISGFGLMPTTVSSRAPQTAPRPVVPSETDTKYQDFLAEMNALGAMAT